MSAELSLLKSQHEATWQLLEAKKVAHAEEVAIFKAALQAAEGKLALSEVAKEDAEQQVALMTGEEGVVGGLEKKLQQECEEKGKWEAEAARLGRQVGFSGGLVGVGG